MFSFNSNLPELRNNYSCQNVKDVPFRWRLFFIALCAYIFVVLLAIGYLTSTIFTDSADPAGVVTVEGRIKYVNEEPGLAQKPARCAERTLSGGSAADFDFLDIDWAQWFALDRV